MKKRNLAIAILITAIGVFTALYLMTIIISGGNAPKIKTTISKRSAYVGDDIGYKIAVSVKDGIELDIPDVEKDLGAFTVRSAQHAKTLQSGKTIIMDTYVLTVYKPGDYTIPSFKILYKYQNDTKWHEFKTRPLEVKVKSLISKDLGRESVLKKEQTSIVDRLMRGSDMAGGSTIMSEKDVPIRYKIKEITDVKTILTYKDISLIAALSFAGIAILILLIIYAWKKIQSVKPPPPPPDEIAMEALKALKASNKTGIKNVKQFYGELFLIAKAYIKSQFKIDEVEMTTKEFISEIHRIKDLDESRKKALEDFINLCDSVKYSGEHVPEEKAFIDLESMREFVKKVSGPKAGA